MSKRTEQLEREVQELRGRLTELSGEKVSLVENSASAVTVPLLIKEIVESRERTVRIINELAAKISKLEKDIEEQQYDADEEPEYPEILNNRAVPLSALDAMVINFVQSRGGLVCADDLVQFMSYKGRNAACARLNKLYREGLLERYQLGHKVYYEYDAGKTTNTLIISPPQ